LYICVEVSKEKEIFLLFKIKKQIQMEKVYTYNDNRAVNPMGNAGAPAADYDCSMNGIVMHKLKV